MFQALIGVSGTIIAAQIGARQMSSASNQDRRRFWGAAAATIAGAQLGMLSPADAHSSAAQLADLPTIKPGTNTSFAPPMQIAAGLMNA